MPKAASPSSAEPHRGPGPALPRRVSEADARRAYRRDVLKLPGPVDAWLRASTAGSAGGGGALRADEVHCTVQMQRTVAPDDGSGFADPDTHVLYLTVRAGEAGASPRVALQTYRGWPDSLDAPEWAGWPPRHMVCFRQRKTSVARFVREALRGDMEAPLTEARRTGHL